MKIKIQSLLCLIGVLFLVSCGSVPVEKKCSVNSDCFPSSCCHAVDTVNAANKPNCSSVLCTADCEPNTLDCGQGEMKCVSGECKIIFN